MAEPISIPRTILFLDHTAKWSGGEIALLRTLEALDRTRVTPVVVLAEEGVFADHLREAQIETHVLPLSGQAREVRKDTLGGSALFRHAGAGMAFARYAFTIARFAKRRGAFALHCNSLKSDLYGGLAGRIAGIPVIWHVRDHIDPSYLPAPAVKVLRALAHTFPTTVIAISESVLEKLFPDPADRQKQLANRVRIIHDGLAERELGTPLPPLTTQWKNDPPRIGIVGRFVAWKGQHIFLQAAQQVHMSGKAGDNEGALDPVIAEAIFVLVGKPLFGEDEYEEELKRMAAPLGNSVQFLGFRSDVPEILRNLDIFVHASTTPEPFGQVVIEAMAEGVPVIASDGGGVREIIEEGVSGLRTPMGDASALADAIKQLLGDPVRANRMARAAHERVRALFTAAQNARKIEAVYDDLAASGRYRTVQNKTEMNSTPPVGSAAQPDTSK
ncbi:MAG: glycosyltransferase family 4 protein [Armatimonadota bacterium]